MNSQSSLASKPSFAGKALNCFLLLVNRLCSFHDTFVALLITPSEGIAGTADISLAEEWAALASVQTMVANLPMATKFSLADKCIVHHTLNLQIFVSKKCNICMFLCCVVVYPPVSLLSSHLTSDSDSTTHSK